MTYLLFLIGFVILIKGGDWLVSGSTSIAKFMVCQIWWWD